MSVFYSDRAAIDLRVDAEGVKVDGRREGARGEREE